MLARNRWSSRDLSPRQILGHRDWIREYWDQFDPNEVSNTENENRNSENDGLFSPSDSVSSQYSITKRQDAVSPEPDFTGYGRSGPGTFFAPSPTPGPTPTPVPNAGLFHTPAALPANPGPPDPIGNLDDDIPPADYADSGNPTVDVHPTGTYSSPYGGGINPGIYNGLYPGDSNPYGNIFEGYMNGMPVFTAQTLSGAYPSSVSNPSGIASNTRGGGNTGGAGQTYSSGPSGFELLFGAPIGTLAPGGINEGQYSAYMASGGGGNSLAQLLSPPRQA